MRTLRQREQRVYLECFTQEERFEETNSYFQNAQNATGCIETKSQSGVLQGCILSLILFLVTIGVVLRPALPEGRRGVQWTTTSFLKYFDYVDEADVELD